MKDLSRASVPFSFDDLSKESRRPPDKPFVMLFGSGAGEAAEKAAEKAPEPPPLSVEEQARKVFDDAYAEGEKAGHEMGMRRAELVAKRLEKQLNEVVAFKQALEKKYERLAVDLALLFAEAVVLRECAGNREILAGMIKKALEACEERGEIVVRVRSEDLRYVEGIGPDNVRLIADDALKEPGFVIETSLGDIDGRISSQIEELKNALVGYVDE
jgi:flagellar biosynthesis/type III secretory pathway protein FliH